MILSRMALVTATLGALAYYASADPWAADANQSSSDPAPAGGAEQQTPAQNPADQQTPSSADQQMPSQNPADQQMPSQNPGDQQTPSSAGQPPQDQAAYQGRTTRIDALNAKLNVVDGQANMIRSLAATMPESGGDRARVDQSVTALDNEVKQTKQQIGELEKASPSEFQNRSSEVDAQMTRLDQMRADAWKQLSSGLHGQPGQPAQPAQPAG
jgi:hypothetical protein